MAVSLRPSDMTQRVRYGVPILVRKRKDRSKIGIYNSPCRTWKCLDCRPELEEKWFAWLSCKIADISTVFVQFVSDANWGSVRMHIQRAGGEYVAIRQEDGLRVVFSNVPESKGEQLTKELAPDTLRRFISSARSFRPIRTSGGWAIPAYPTQSSEWERVQELPMDVRTAAEQLTVLGVIVAWYFGCATHGFTAQLPENTDLLVVDNELRIVPCAVPRTAIIGDSS